MMKNIFKKKRKRPKREVAGLSAKYLLCFNKEEDCNFDLLQKIAIVEDISKQGLKLTITPVFKKKILTKVKKEETFVFVKFSFEPDGVPIHVKTIVRWIDNENNYFPAVTVIGLEFTGLSMEDKVLLSQFMTKKEKSSKS